ncbi:four helix bundle protein [Mesonia sp. K7]|uniref:four helix bundle protein n=1 Tax=Mesonia sp. K7 TaxID=2218606 RepID=UPI000DA9FF4F|nr:four helix bundle protein [Mesonia sp. K7]PZD79668.1 four helix bundle protein [Mesonia sp. K7]
MHNYEQLTVWQKAMDLVEKVYLLTEIFPKEETYGLTSQVKRSAVSIPSNISEGAGRKSDKEFNYFLSIANGSTNELCTQIHLAYRLNLVSKEQVEPILEEISEIQKINYTLIKKFSKT